MALTFSKVGWRPSADILYPKYSTEESMNEHFAAFQPEISLFQMSEDCLEVVEMLFRGLP